MRNEFNDEIKGTAGGVATWVFIVTSIVLFVLDGGIGALFSLRALAFIVIGMFVAAVVIGGLTYGLSRLISRRLARSMGNDQLFDPQYARRVTRIGWVMQIANIIIGVAFTLSLYGILFWS